MKKQYCYLVCLLLLTQCSPNRSDYQPKDLRLLSQAEVLAIARQSSLVNGHTVFKNQQGKALSTNEKDLLNQGLLAKDYYVDESGLVKEIVLRSPDLEDQLLEIQVQDLAAKEWEKIVLIDVDCNMQEQILEQVYEIDQGARTGGPYNMQDADSVCLQAVMSLIDKCGFPSKEEVGETGMSAIFLVFQHSEAGIMAYFYPQLMEAVDRGDIRMTSMALMQDRMLMRHGLRQYYGSQISDGGLYPVHDPANLNKRREAIGLQPIEDYLKRWDIEFRVEDYE